MEYVPSIIVALNPTPNLIGYLVIWFMCILDLQNQRKYTVQYHVEPEPVIEIRIESFSMSMDNVIWSSSNDIDAHRERLHNGMSNSWLSVWKGMVQSRKQ